MGSVLIKLEKRCSVILIAGIFCISCSGNNNKEAKLTDTVARPQGARYDTSFKVEAEAFADLQILRYQVPGFTELSLAQKQLAYYLYEAALSGRDIIYDQKSKNGLLIRRTLETIYSSYSGDRTSPDWKNFETYCGRFWFSNGNHHHYGNEKFIPEISFEYFTKLAQGSDTAQLPRDTSENIASFLLRIKPLVFDSTIEPKLTNLAPDIDNVANSSVNFYEGVSQKEVEAYYAKFDTKGNAPSWGLNSKLAKVNGKLVEKTWKVGGMYSFAIEQIVGWLEKASAIAENAEQKKAIDLLIQYYQSGDLKIWDAYSMAWVSDINSRLDVVSGFIEVYMDAIGKKGSFESIVSIKDMEATKRIEAISRQAQWFEDNSPLIPEHKKKNVKGIIAKAITVVVECGDAAPNTPIGINLPNADWIRKDHGSKSVSLSNIIYSYNVANAKSGMLSEYALDDTTIARARKFGNLASDLHTDMHECIGHASGQINPGVETPDKTLKNYSSCLEEARADLVALYYIQDQKLVSIGVAPSTEVGKAEYDSYMLNGLMTQLTRLKLGAQVEEAHMRNRQLIARWAYEKGKMNRVVEFIQKNGKTYVRINDYAQLRSLFGQLLREIQRIKSEGDYTAGKALVETYGVKVDPVLHREILERYARLNVKPYRGFIQPRLVPVMEGEKITDIKIEYPSSFFAQMIEYGKNYSFLPLKN